MSTLGPRWKMRLQSRALRTLRKWDARLEWLRRRLSPAPLTLFRDVTAPWLASALCVAARLRLADRLAGRAQPLSLLAEESGLGALDLRRLLGVLAAHGYFQVQGETVSPTPLSRALERGAVGDFVELQGRGWYRQAFSSSTVLQSWQQGVTPFERAAGQPFFDYLETDQQASALFLGAMADITRFCTPYLVMTLELQPGTKFLDVGGGDGELARALARHYPTNALAVLDRALTDTSLCGKTPNYRFHRGDFFREVPSGYDHLCLKNILHDWEDDECLLILRHCREAVSPGARLTVIECPLLAVDADATMLGAETYALDWNVWMTLSGRERTAEQYRELLERSGWSWRREVATATPYALIEAVAE